MDCDQVLFPFVSSLTHSYLTRDQVLFSRKGEKRTASFPPRLNSHFNHSTLSSVSIEQRSLMPSPTDSLFSDFVLDFPLAF